MMLGQQNVTIFPTHSQRNVPSTWLLHTKTLIMQLRKVQFIDSNLMFSVNKMNQEQHTINYWGFKWRCLWTWWPNVKVQRRMLFHICKVLSPRFHEHSQFLHVNSEILPQIMPQLLATASFPMHCSLIILPSEVLAASLNKPLII
jgi:competence transcription factor ComK